MVGNRIDRCATHVLQIHNCCPCDPTTPCVTHANYSVRTASKISTAPLANTAQPLAAALILCTGAGSAPNWPTRLTDPLARAIDAAATSIAADVGAPVRAAACDADPAPHAESGAAAVLVMPQNVVLHGVTVENATDAIRAALLGSALPEGTRVESRGDRATVLVCAHAARDARCGEAGPLLVREMKAYAARHGVADVDVFASSHLGGHKFAGVVAVWPFGDWYGRVRACDVPRMMQEAVRGKPVEHVWRGRAVVEGARKKNGESK
ncbi:hypothetical protein GGF32_009386 [Allomyces javanicus]|nr:hypothetical protein GGF32_009386 [Allomyces javanicus]